MDVAEIAMNLTIKALELRIVQIQKDTAAEEICKLYSEIYAGIKNCIPSNEK